MKAICFGILFLSVTAMAGQALADTRRLACALSFTTSQYGQGIPGKSIGFDDGAVSNELAKLIAAGKHGLVNVDLKDNFSNVEVELTAQFGPECEVAAVPGCNKINQGPLIHKVVILVTDKTNNQKFKLDTGNLPTTTLERGFASMSFTPASKIKDSNGNQIESFGVQCGDVAY